jgi:hypothetical protein
VNDAVSEHRQSIGDAWIESGVHHFERGLGNNAQMETRDWSDPDFDPSKGPIMVRVGTVEELFNPIDPQPLNLRDLDTEIADWIGEWAEEQHGNVPIVLKIVVSDESAGGREGLVAAGIKNHFAYRKWASGRKLSRLWRDGRISLVIGLTALVSLTTASRLINSTNVSAFAGLIREGLAVAGWVAMWRPMEIFLYEWWPLRREVRNLQRISEAEIVFARR